MQQPAEKPPLHILNFLMPLLCHILTPPPHTLPAEANAHLKKLQSNVSAKTGENDDLQQKLHELSSRVEELRTCQEHLLVENEALKDNLAEAHMSQAQLAAEVCVCVYACVCACVCDLCYSLPSPPSVNRYQNCRRSMRSVLPSYKMRRVRYRHCMARPFLLLLAATLAAHHPQWLRYTCT